MTTLTKHDDEDDDKRPSVIIATGSVTATQVKANTITAKTISGPGSITVRHLTADAVRAHTITGTTRPQGER